MHTYTQPEIKVGKSVVSFVLSLDSYMNNLNFSLSTIHDEQWMYMHIRISTSVVAWLTLAPAFTSLSTISMCPPMLAVKSGLRPTLTVIITCK